MTSEQQIDLPEKVLDAVKVIQNAKRSGLTKIQQSNLKRIQAYLRGMRKGTNTGKPGRPRLPIEEVVRRALEKHGGDGRYFDRLLVKRTVGNKRALEDIEAEIDRLIQAGEVYEVDSTICIAPMGVK